MLVDWRDAKFLDLESDEWLKGGETGRIKEKCGGGKEGESAVSLVEGDRRV